MCPFACLCPVCRRGVAKGLIMALSLFRLRDSLENLLEVMDLLPRKMPICQTHLRVHIILRGSPIP